MLLLILGKMWPGCVFVRAIPTESIMIPRFTPWQNTNGQRSWQMHEFKQGLAGTFQITCLWVIELMTGRCKYSDCQKSSPVQCLFKLMPGTSSAVTPNWFAVFLMTMLLWQSELKSPAYRFPLSHTCHSNGRPAAAIASEASLAPSTPAAKWKKTSSRLIYMLMVWSPTFCLRPLANQMPKYGLFPRKLFLL